MKTDAEMPRPGAATGSQSDEQAAGVPPVGAEDSNASESVSETFPRKVVEELRRENAKYRERAKRADDLAARLHTALVAATGRLADPSDLPYDEAHLDDADALNAAIDALLAAKPHLASRRPRGDVDQGPRGAAPVVGLGALLRARA